MTSTLVDGFGMYLPIRKLVLYNLKHHRSCRLISKTGASRFQEVRNIPSNNVKSFFFGFVPSIFFEAPISRLMAFGSEREVANTLESLGCTGDALALYKKRHHHHFSR